MRRNIVLLFIQKWTSRDKENEVWGMTPLERYWENFLRRLPRLLCGGAVIIAAIYFYQDQTTPEQSSEEVPLSAYQLKEIQYWNSQVASAKEATTLEKAFQALASLSLPISDLTCFNAGERAQLLVYLKQTEKQLVPYIDTEDGASMSWHSAYEKSLEQLIHSHDK